MDYSKLAKLAQSTIKKYGRSVTITRTTPQSYSVVSDAQVAVEAAFGTSAVLKNPTRREIDGTNVLAGDVFAVISGAGVAFEPAPEDTVTIGAEVWNVVTVQAASPAETAISYTLQLRK